MVGREPSAREQQVFEIVKAARDATVKVVSDAFESRQPIAGWQADDAARAVIVRAGFGEFFTHRTGHNIGNILHGNGAHLDNLETHDERLILPNTCFSVEPGIYLNAFGIRSELNMIATTGRASATGRVQQELVRIADRTGGSFACPLPLVVENRLAAHRLNLRSHEAKRREPALPVIQGKMPPDQREGHKVWHHNGAKRARPCGQH